MYVDGGSDRTCTAAPACADVMGPMYSSSALRMARTAPRGNWAALRRAVEVRSSLRSFCSTTMLAAETARGAGGAGGAQRQRVERGAAHARARESGGARHAHGGAAHASWMQHTSAGESAGRRARARGSNTRARGGGSALAGAPHRGWPQIRVGVGVRGEG
eukprot:3352266-Prymnesium_polylepis.1